jgi:hypothetical protein
MLAVILFASSLAHCAEVPMYFVIGQSNAMGSPGTNTMVYNRAGFPDSRVTLWSANVGSTTLVSNQTLRAPNTQQWGVEMMGGKVLADWHGDEHIAILKVGLGGTDLNHDWEKGNTTGAECYASLSNWFVTATADLASVGDTPDVRGAIWVQGEDDANDGTHGDYYSNLTNFISDIRSDYGEGIRFVVVRLSRFASWRSGFTTVRAAQEQVASDIDNVYLIDSDPCFMPWKVGTGRHDSHFGQRGLWDLGLRCGHGMTQRQRATIGASVWIRNDGWSE